MYSFEVGRIHSKNSFALFLFWNSRSVKPYMHITFFHFKDPGAAFWEMNQTFMRCSFQAIVVEGWVRDFCIKSGIEGMTLCVPCSC